MQLTRVPSGFLSNGSFAEPGNGLIDPGRPPAPPFSTRLPMRIMASSVGVLYVDTEMPNSLPYHRLRCARSQSATSSQMIGVPPPPKPTGSSPRLWKPTRYCTGSGGTLVRYENACDDADLAALRRVE